MICNLFHSKKKKKKEKRKIQITDALKGSLYLPDFFLMFYY